MSKFGIFIPTYNRKSPLCLNLLTRDSDIELNLCVRSELYDKGFYDELEKLDRVNIVKLGYGLTELGETRERIMEIVKLKNIDYCLMLDDGVKDIFDVANSNFSLTQVIECAIRVIEESENAIGFTFLKRHVLDENGKSIRELRHFDKLYERYFLTFPTQAVLLDMKKVLKYDLHYQSLSTVGFEDAAFFGDAIKCGLTYVGSYSIQMNAIAPNIKKSGGSHSESEQLEERYDTLNKRCMKYLNMMGTSIEKRYRNYVGGYLSLIIWDLDFFRDVLITNREKNQKIIDNHFKL